MEANIAKLHSKFGIDSKGRLGVSSKSNVNVIVSKDPLGEATKTWRILSQGGRIQPIPGKSGFVATFKQGEAVTFRPTSSSDGSPAVDINTSKDRYRIHFIAIASEKKGYSK